MEGDGQSLIDVILVFQNVPPPHKSRAASGIDSIGNLHAAFASEHSLQIHIEPADAYGCGGHCPGPVKIGGNPAPGALNRRLAGNAVKPRDTIQALFVVDVFFDNVGKDDAADISLFPQLFANGLDDLDERFLIDAASGRVDRVSVN